MRMAKIIARMKRRVLFETFFKGITFLN